MIWDMKIVLEAYCSSEFPYVCTGEKTIREDGSCECECGNITYTPEQYEEFRNRKRDFKEPSNH